jgi:hypothetical protein
MFFCDDGWTGTNFERPDFLRMMKEVERGNINTVIVKDLSRFGRDYVKIGYYLSEYFPEHDIRFIAITENVIRNRVTEFAVYVNSACDVKIAGNDFGAYRGGDTPDRFAKAIRIMGAMNIEIADNTYSPINPAVTEVVVAEHNKNVFGKDVEWEGESVIPDSE